MSTKITFRAIQKEFEAGYLFIPATAEDKRSVNAFCGDMTGKYVTVTVNGSRGNKTYDQVKTVWGLIEIYFESQYNRKPTKTESANMYMSFIQQYADTEQSLIDPSKEVYVTLSNMSKEQAARFIQNIMNDIIVECKLSEGLQCDVKELYEAFIQYKGTLPKDPVDYDKNGVLLNREDWVKMNPCSHASGVTKGLEVAHIVSKGSDEEDRYECWNWLMLTHEEHIGIQHQNGWEELIELYPHIEGRVKRARELAGKLDKLNDE